MDNDNSDIVINIFSILTNYMLLFVFPLSRMRQATRPRAVSMLKLFSLCLDNVTFSAVKIQSIWTPFYPSPWKYDPSLLKYDHLAKINLYRGCIILVINILPKHHIFQLYEGISGFVCEGLHDSGFLYRKNEYLCHRFQ